MSITQVVIVAGGQSNLWPDITKYQTDETYWIGVDRGAFYLLEHQLVPGLAVGDFDSLSARELAEVEKTVPEIYYAAPEKDHTDTQLALTLALKRHKLAAIIIIGATGGRLDHFLSNLWLPLEPRFAADLPRIRLVDKQNTVTYFTAGEYVLTKEKDKKYLAYVCLTPVSQLTLYDAKYPLRKQQVEHPLSYASNEFIGETTRFSFTAGVVAVIQSKD